jgi:hypothetical protein
MEKTTRHIASFDVASVLIEELLCFPKDYKIIGAGWDSSLDNIRLFVEGQDFPEIECGQIAHLIHPTITTITNEDGTRAYTWDWKC